MPTNDAKYTKPELRNRLKNEVMAGSDGGKPGQWSARKAQILAQRYENAGGGYSGKKTDAQRSLSRWTDEDWRTSDGKPAIREGGTRRYLPDAAWEKLSPSEKAATNRKKIAGSKNGEQFVANTDRAKQARRSVVVVGKACGGGVYKTDKVYSSRYRAKQKLYRRKVKPAKIDNPMALPSMASNLVVKHLPGRHNQGSHGGDGIPNLPRSADGRIIPPPPNTPYIRPERRLVRENKYARISPTIVEHQYNPNIGNKLPDPGEIVIATIHWRDRDGTLGSKSNKRVLVLGPVKGKPGVMGGLILTSEKKKDASGRRDTTHLPVPSYDGDGGKVSLADITQIIELWPEDFESEADKADKKFFADAWALTVLWHNKRGDMRKQLRIDVIEKAFGGKLLNAGKGYAADKLRGGSRIAESMTAAERSARTKAGWKNRKRAVAKPFSPGMRPKTSFDRFYERPVGSMMGASREMRQRIVDTAKEVVSQTDVARGYKEAKDQQRKVKEQHQERRQARKDLFDYIRSGDSSILDRYIPEDVIEDARQKADAAEQDRIRQEDADRKMSEKAAKDDALRRAQSRKKQEALSAKRKKIVAGKEKAKQQEEQDKKRQKEIARRKQDAYRTKRERILQQKERERLAAEKTAEKEKTASKKEADKNKAKKLKDKRDAEFHARRMEIMEQREKDRLSSKKKREKESRQREAEKAKREAEREALRQSKAKPEQKPEPEPIKAPLPSRIKPPPSKKRTPTGSISS